MNLTVIVPPQFEPVSLQDVYTHLRLDPDETGSPNDGHPDDALLTTFIQAAREAAEKFMARSIMQQTIRMSDSGFPGQFWPGSRHFIAPWNCHRAHERRIELLRPPVISVNSVIYLDGANAPQTVDPTAYFVTDDVVPQLRFVNEFGFPSTYRRDDAVRVEYVAGYMGTGSPPSTQAEAADTVPASVKSAILMGVQLQYDNLNPGDRAALQTAWANLLGPFQVLTIA